MFCPKCGQQQASDDVRFCPRCGFQLGIIKGLIATDGALLAQGEAESGSSPRSIGIRHGIMMMLLTALVVPVSAILFRMGILPKEFVALAAIFFSVGGFLRLVYALLMQEGARSSRKQINPAALSPAQLRTGAHIEARALPPQQSMPAGDFRNVRGRTAEIAQPPSVTENTTKLLDKTDGN